MSESEVLEEEEKEEDQEEKETIEYTQGSFRFLKENSKILKSIVETLSSIIDETEFIITDEGLEISAMDPSRICLLKLEIGDRDFDEFESDGNTKVAFNLDDLDKIMKRGTSSDQIELKYSANDNKIQVVMKREETSRKRTFTLKLLDIDTEEIPMDNLLAIEYPSSWTMDPDFFEEAIKDAEIYSEILNMKAVEGEGLTFESSGQIGEMVYFLGVEDLLESDLHKEGQGAYSLTFLKSILKIKSITEKLNISLKTDHPLKMIFDIFEGGKLSYFLAPRVDETQSEDEDMEEFE
jgi:proliferating cell nuclear antigen